jgi:hypothetical protein
MTDIVERLRETEIDCYTPPEVTRECREAADEIERLTKYLQDTVVDAEIIQIARLKAEAEVERLRGLLREWLDGATLRTLEKAQDFPRRVREALGDE